MPTLDRIELALDSAVDRAARAGAPPLLASALHYAVFPGGHRIRPHLCLAVARACGDAFPSSTDAAAAAIELLHCASLVHDDLPCFDDADTRRGKPSVHAEFGAPIAVLTGDALIVLAFETLAREAAPAQLGRLLAHRRRGGRRAARNRRGPGLGMRGRRPARRLSAGQDRRAVRRLDDGRRRLRRRRIPSRGGRSARRSARPTRSPTTCATCSATPTNLASRSARTRRAPGRTPPPSSGSPAPRPGSSIWSRRLRRRSRPVRGAPSFARRSRRRRDSSSRSSSPASPPDPAGAMGGFDLCRLAVRAAALGTGAAGSSPIPRFSAGRRNRRLRAGSRVGAARALFDLCAGFVYSQILSACVKLEVFEILLPGPQTCDSVAGQTGLDPAAALRLLKAAASLRSARGPARRSVRARRSRRGDDRQSRGRGFRRPSRSSLRRPGRSRGPAARREGNATVPLLDLFRQTGRGRTTTRSGSDGTRRLQRPDVADPGARRRDRPRRLSVRSAIGGSSTSAAARAPFSPRSARRAPKLDLTLFDLPPVAERARARLAALGLAGA